MRKTSAFLTLMSAFLFIVSLSLYPDPPPTGYHNNTFSQELKAILEQDGFAARTNDLVSKIDKNSMDSNIKGYLAYEKKDYIKSEEYFWQALQADAANMFSHYNLACTLSLYYADKDLSRTAYANKKNLYKAIVRHLYTALDLEIHFGYQLFFDSDLDPVRKKGFPTTMQFPCPGDCCPDQWYFFKDDGTVGYNATYPDLSGLGTTRTPDPACSGWYTVIGNYAFVFIPGRQELLKAKFPSDLSPATKSGMENGFECFTIIFNDKQLVENIRYPDLWD